LRYDRNQIHMLDYLSITQYNRCGSHGFTIKTFRQAGPIRRSFVITLAASVDNPMEHDALGYRLASHLASFSMAARETPP
jgi:hypothetical protein